MYQCINTLNNTNSYHFLFSFLNYLSCNFQDFGEYQYIEHIPYKDLYNNNNNNNNNNELLDKNEYKVFNYYFMNVINELHNTLNNNYPETYNITIITLLIILFDNSLIYLFSNKARWFQLHALVNLIITIIIVPEFYNIVKYPETGYNSITKHSASYYIIISHIYHILTFKNLGLYDYFHHILFVALGVVPCFCWLQTNQSYLAYIPCSGIPGIIEYVTLALYKNNKISLYTQKKVNSINYNFLRLPLCVMGASFNFIAYNNGNLVDNKFLTFYLNSLLFLNGALFNYLTLNSFFYIKYKINRVIYSEKKD
jgi:hypothetical protein